MSSSKLLLSALATFAVLLPMAGADAAERPNRGKRGDGSRPAYTKTTGTKPVANRPVTSKPVVLKPVIAKPVITKPVVSKPPVVVTPRPVVNNKPDWNGGADAHVSRRHGKGLYPWGLRGARWVNDHDEGRPSHQRRHKRWWMRAWH
jgi:hypothetical protein